MKGDRAARSSRDLILMKRSPILILFVTLFLDLLGFGLIIPLIPSYIEHYGGKPWVGGALLACYSLMQFVCAPLWGKLSDRIGRRPVILAGLIGSASAFLAFGLAPNLLVLFIARVCAGALTAASLPTAQAYIADVTPPEKRSGGMALLGIAFGLGFAFGPAVGGYAARYSLPILHNAPIQTPALIAAGLSFLNFLWAVFMLPESHFPGDPPAGLKQESLFTVFPDIARVMSNPQVKAQMLVYAFVTFSFTAVESAFSWLIILRFHDVLSVMAQHLWTSAHPGLLWTSMTAHARELQVEAMQGAETSHIFLLVGVTSLVVQGFIVKGLTRILPENRMVMVGVFLMVLALMGIAVAHTLGAMEWVSVVLAIGTSMNNPALFALITQAAGPNERGTLTGAQQGLGSLARIISPPINTYMVQKKASLPFFASAAIMLVGFMLSLRLKPLNQNAADSNNDGAQGAVHP